MVQTEHDEEVRKLVTELRIIYKENMAALDAYEEVGTFPAGLWEGALELKSRRDEIEKRLGKISSRNVMGANQKGPLPDREG